MALLVHQIWAREVLENQSSSVTDYMREKFELEEGDSILQRLGEPNWSL